MPAEPQRATRSRRSALSIAARASGMLAIAAFIALLAYGLATNSPETTIDDALARAEAVSAPEFDLEVLDTGQAPAPLRARVEAAADDGRIALAELRGTPIVLNVWASWCIPCREEAPLLEQEWRRAQTRGVLFLGLNVQDLIGDAREFVREFGLTFPHVREPENRTARRYGATGLPETFFISPSGRVVAHVIGVVKPAQLRAGVAAAERDRPIAPDQGGARQGVR